jgi:hypothetical protein
VCKKKDLCVQIRFLCRLHRRCSGRGSRMLCSHLESSPHPNLRVCAFFHRGQYLGMSDLASDVAEVGHRQLNITRTASGKERKASLQASLAHTHDQPTETETKARHQHCALAQPSHRCMTRRHRRRLLPWWRLARLRPWPAAPLPIRNGAAYALPACRLLG